MLNTPVLFIIFNRPETTAQVFEAIRKAQPTRLFVAADGPRPDKTGEKEQCEEARKIATAIDWDCEVHTLFRDENRGCGRGPAEAISWFFEHVEQGIILEDDCVPGPYFFTFCTQMLERYKDDERVMHICGNNFSFQKKWTAPYYFGYYFTAWGWATWRRAWEKYDFSINALDSFFESRKLDKIALNSKQRAYWTEIFELVREGKRQDIWDYQWIFTCWWNNALAVTPAVNLVTNIGFDDQATHTKSELKVSYVKALELHLPLTAQPVKRNRKLDQLVFSYYFDPSQHINNLRNFFYKLFPVQFIKPLRIIRRKFLPHIK